MYCDAIHRNIVGNRRGILAVLHAANVRASRRCRLTKRTKRMHNRIIRTLMKRKNVAHLQGFKSRVK